MMNDTVKLLTERDYASVTDADLEIAIDIKENITYGDFNSDAETTRSETLLELARLLT